MNQHEQIQKNYSVRPKRVNTETTETEISVGFTEPKLPNRNYRTETDRILGRFCKILVLSMFYPNNIMI